MGIVLSDGSNLFRKLIGGVEVFAVFNGNVMKQDVEKYTQIIIDSIADGVFTVDKDWRITSYNRAAEKITGIGKNEAIGRYCWEVFKASICERRCSLRETIESGQPIVNQPIFIINSEGERIPISISTAVLKDANGTVVGGVETFRDLSVIEELRKELTSQYSFLDIVSKNKEMHRLFEMLELISESDATILLEGESGTGKELFAKAIHSLSHRKKGPMITVNCGALPDTLLESELFGYKAGALPMQKKISPDVSLWRKTEPSSWTKSETFPNCSRYGSCGYSRTKSMNLWVQQNPKKPTSASSRPPIRTWRIW